MSGGWDRIYASHICHIIVLARWSYASYQYFQSPFLNPSPRSHSRTLIKMVHYIRFLKPPRLIANAKLPTRTSLTALITITTDLGDAFYPGDVDVHVALAEQDNVTSLGTVCWKSGMRCLRVEIQVALHTSTYPARFLFTCCESLRMDSLQLGQLPDIVSAWTEDFHADDDLKLDADLIIRSFRLPNGQVLKICEENGESIARHIW